MQRTQRTRFDGRVAGTTLVNPDFELLAQAFGIDFHQATAPAALESAIGDAITTNAPTLIEVAVDPMPSPWHLIHDFLAK